MREDLEKAVGALQEAINTLGKEQDDKTIQVINIGTLITLAIVLTVATQELVEINQTLQSGTLKEEELK